MFEDKTNIKTDVKKKKDTIEGQPEGTLQQNLHDANPGDQDLSGKKLNALNKNGDVDGMSWTQIPHEEVRPELQRDMTQP